MINMEIMANVKIIADFFNYAFEPFYCFAFLFY